MKEEKRALLSLQANFNKFAQRIEKQCNLARDTNCHIELAAQELLKNTFFQLRFDVEENLDSLGLNEFCGLAAFKHLEKVSTTNQGA